MALDRRNNRRYALRNSDHEPFFFLEGMDI